MTETTRVRIRAGSTEDSGGCWVWHRSRHKLGYARISIAGKTVSAHRVAYEAFVGPIPAGLVIDHLCRNRACVNPAHMEPVEQKVNVHRSPLAIAAVNAKKTECKQGHSFTAANTYISPAGTRTCKTCRRAAQR